MSMDQLIERASEQITPSAFTFMLMDMVGLFYLVASDVDGWLSVLTHALVAISMGFTIVLKYKKYISKNNNENPNTDQD